MPAAYFTPHLPCWENTGVMEATARLPAEQRAWHRPSNADAETVHASADTAALCHATLRHATMAKIGCITAGLGPAMQTPQLCMPMLIQQRFVMRPWPRSDASQAGGDPPSSDGSASTVSPKDRLADIPGLSVRTAPGGLGSSPDSWNRSPRHVKASTSMQSPRKMQHVVCRICEEQVRHATWYTLDAKARMDFGLP